MLSAVVLPDRGAMNAVRVSSQDANRAVPRPAGRWRSPSSSPVSPAGSTRGLAPPSDGRSLIAVCAAGIGASGLICGLAASVATGSPGRGIRAAMTRHVRVPAVTAAPVSATTMSKTRTVGVPGQVWPVCPWARLMIQCSPNGRTWRPASAAAIRAASQASHAPAARPQPSSRTTQTPAPLPARIGTRGPAARLIAGILLFGLLAWPDMIKLPDGLRGWPGQLRELPGVRDSARRCQAGGAAGSAAGRRAAVTAPPVRAGRGGGARRAAAGRPGEGARLHRAREGDPG